MRPCIYEFSITDSVHSNKEFAEKVSDPVYNTFWSIFSWKRLLLCYFIDKFANEGKFLKTGRYTLVLIFVGARVKACLTRKII